MEDLTDSVASLSVTDGKSHGKRQHHRNKKKSMKREKPCEKPWQRLSAEERRLAELLNFKRETWGDEPIGDEEDGYCEDWSSISWTWAALDGELLASAKALGFDASSWNGGQQDDQGQDESSGGGGGGGGGEGGRGRRRRKRKPPLLGAHAVPCAPVNLDGTDFTPSTEPRYIAPRKQWSELPDWIVLSDERGAAKSGCPFPPLSEDPLFREDGGPLMLPFKPSAGTPAGRGAAVGCPGGNYEFLHPREGPPVARFLAESLGIPTFVLRYRLLPAHGLDAMQEDLQRAVRLAREKCGGGPVLAIGFSAGGHLVSSGSAASVAAGRDMGRPDCQALIYPCTNPDGYLIDEECGFWRAEVDTPQVKSLAHGREWLRAGAAFVTPPPTFVVASTGDDVCPPESDTDPYVAAAEAVGCPVRYLKGDFGNHGFGLQRFWAEPCVAWLKGRGFGSGHTGAAAAGSGADGVGDSVDSAECLDSVSLEAKPHTDAKSGPNGGKDRRRRGGRGKGGGSSNIARQTREDNGGTNA